MAEKSEELVTVQDKVAQGKELFARGSRNYLVRAYNDAADDLSQVCNIYEDIYGQLSDELGVPYLLYAKTLIALAEDENKVISVPDERNDDDDDEDEDDANAEDGGNADENKEQEVVAADSTKPDESNDSEVSSKSKESNDAKVDDKEAECLPTNGSTTGEGVNGDTKKNDDEESADDKNEASDAEPGPSGGDIGEKNEEKEDEEEDEGSSLQVAWEILELAVIIFERQGETAKSKLAEAYSELAGISFENSHFDAAIADYKKSLELHMNLPDDNRRIVAEIHYKIGLAHMMQNAFDDCIKELKRASELIEEEIEEEKQKENLSDKEKDAIKDLEETRQDILVKIAEVEETKTQSSEDVRKKLLELMDPKPKAKEETVGCSSSSSSAAGGSSSAEKPKPTDISHLIKRKKPDTTSVGEVTEGSPAKKPAV